MSRIIELAEKYSEIVQKEKEIKQQKAEMKELIVKEVGGGYKSSFLTVSRQSGHTAEIPDIQKMKDAGVWDFYKKTSYRSPTVRITVKPDELKVFKKQLQEHLENTSEPSENLDISDEEEEDDLPY